MTFQTLLIVEPRRRHMAACSMALDCQHYHCGAPLNIDTNTQKPRFVLGQSIRQRPPGTAAQNSRLYGVPLT